MELPRGGRGTHDHLDDGWGQPDHFFNPDGEIVGEPFHESVPGAFSLTLTGRIKAAKLVGKELDDSGITILRRCHRFDDAARVGSMVVPVIGHEASIALV